MTATVFASGSIFVNALSPVILESRPGEFQQMLADVRPLQLTNILDVGPGILRRLNIGQDFSQPWKFAAFTAARSMPLFNMHAAIFDGWTMAAIAENPHVSAIYEDRPIRLLQYPFAPAEGTFSVATTSGTMNFTSTQWTRRLLGADVANAKGFTGKGINAVVVDTGGTKGNQQTVRMVRETVIPGNRFDVVSHGEWCASSLGGALMKDQVFSAITRMPVYCEGMAPQCNLMQVKALDFIIGTAPTSMLIAGLERAVQMGADVISCSWGGTVTSTQPQGSPFYNVMQNIVDRNILVGVAAGNSGPGASTIDDPGAMPQVLTVGAYNAVGNTFNSMFGQAGEMSNFSSRGPTPWGDIKPDTVGPGAIIDSGVSPVSEMAVSYTHRPHNASAIAGTSMATPQIMGVVACMRQAHKQLLGKTLTNDEVKAMLAALGQPKSNDAGWGPLTWQMYERWLNTQYNVTL